MIKRYFGLFNTRALLVTLAVFYVLVLTSDNINGVVEIIGGMTLMTLFTFLWNVDATANWKYVWTGDKTTLTDDVLTKEGIRLREARKGNETPLFIYAYNKYYYQDDNFTKGHE